MEEIIRTILRISPLGLTQRRQRSYQNSISGEITHARCILGEIGNNDNKDDEDKKRKKEKK